MSTLAFAGDKPAERYHFQLGPRAWETVKFRHNPDSVDAHAPGYAQEAERLASRLMLARWEEHARAIFDRFAGTTAKDGTAEIEVYLGWQSDGRLCAIRDTAANKVLYLQWANGSLTLSGEADPAPLDRLLKKVTCERPIVSVAEGAANIVGTKMGKIEELRGTILWRYASNLDGDFQAILFETCRRLQGLSGNIGLAFSEQRFNDACGDDAWQAVRIGDLAWENGAYFERNAASLRTAPPDMHLVLGILNHLIACDIKGAFEHAFGYRVSPGHVIGVFREDGSYYFACCYSWGDAGPVYRIDPVAEQVALVGFTERFDWNFNDSRRDGWIVPKARILETLALDDMFRRVEAGNFPFLDWNELGVAWEHYLPKKPIA